MIEDSTDLGKKVKDMLKSTHWREIMRLKYLICCQDSARANISIKKTEKQVNRLSA